MKQKKPYDFPDMELVRLHLFMDVLTPSNPGENIVPGKEEEGEDDPFGLNSLDAGGLLS